MVCGVCVCVCVFCLCVVVMCAVLCVFGCRVICVVRRASFADCRMMYIVCRMLCVCMCAFALRVFVARRCVLYVVS